MTSSPPLDYNLIRNVKDNHPHEVQKLILLKANVNAVKKATEGITPLMIASERGNKMIVEHLLQNKADTNLQNSKGRTALMVAACQGYPHILRVLIAAGADLNIQDNDGLTSLLCAIERKHNMCAMMLIEAKASLTNPRSALVHASLCENMEMIDWLISHKAPLEQIDKDGNTALTIAANMFRPTILEMLIEAKANVNHQNIVGNSALMIACNGHLIGIHTLLEYGASVNLKNNRGHTASDICKKTHGSDIVSDNLRRLKKDRVELMMSDVKYNDTVTKPIVPLPVHGGHRLLFETIDDYIEQYATQVNKSVDK